MQNSCPGAGACGGMYTANTMASAIEALGMSLPYSSSLPAEDPLKLMECRLAGRCARSNALGTYNGGVFMVWTAVCSSSSSFPCKWADQCTLVGFGIVRSRGSGTSGMCSA